MGMLCCMMQPMLQLPCAAGFLLFQAVHKHLKHEAHDTLLLADDTHHAVQQYMVC